MKSISCFWLTRFIFVNLISLAISSSVDNFERADGNVNVRRPIKSREWLEQVRAEGLKHDKNHPVPFDAGDIVSTDMKPRGFFSSSSSSSSSSEEGLKKVMKRQRKMFKRSKKYGRYPPYGYGQQRFGRYPPPRYGGSNYGYGGGNYGGNYRLGGGFGGPGMLPPPLPAF